MRSPGARPASSGGRNAGAPRRVRRPGAGRSAGGRARGARAASAAASSAPRWPSPISGSSSRTPKRAQRHPAQGVQVAQAAGAVLEVGLEVFGGVAETRMARRAVPRAWRRRNRAAATPACGAIASASAACAASSAASGAPFHQRGEHGLVGGGLGALRRPNAPRGWPAGRHPTASRRSAPAHRAAPAASRASASTSRSMSECGNSSPRP